VIHERARLSVLTSLITNPKGLIFNDLKQLCSLTDGNLSRHLRVLETERTKIAADASYRSPIGVLERLAGDEVFLSLPGGLAAPEKRLRATNVSALVARFVAREYGGDRVAAVRESAARVGRILGASRRTSWPPSERRAFERMSLVAALIGDLARWPIGARRALVAVMRAKGGRSEMRYARQLDGHRRLRRSLEALTSA